jgi:osmotically-inducible protein OsmY
MAADDTVKAYQINVDTANGVVTLTGTVDNPAAKTQALTIVRNTDGVRDVIDRIEVSQSAATAGRADFDDRIANQAERAGSEIKQESRELGSDIKRETRELGSDAKRETSKLGSEIKEESAQAGRAVGDAAITTAVKTKFLADTTVKGLKIDVDTSNGVVTLNGTVASAAEADRAMMLARNTEGVKSVVNKLKIGRY